MVKKLFLLSILSVIFVPIFSLNAQSVDILWQGETYTPPFYEGRALWSKQSIITIMAVPQGLGAPLSLNYKWITDGTVLGMVSGVGRNVLTFEDSLFSRPQRITVQIVTNDNEVLAESSTVVTPIDAIPLIYEKNPLLGYMFHREVRAGFRLKVGEVSLSAFPLFTSPAIRDGANLTYSWTTNSGEVGIGNTVTYKTPESVGGLARINLEISNNDRIVSEMVRDFLIKFGEE